MDNLIVKTRQFVQERWELDELHGISHWDRVYENGQKLITHDVNPLVVGLFAYLHDSCRKHNGEDLEHGVRAAEWIETIRESLLADVSDKEIELLKRACRLHTTAHKTGDPTIDGCFDADRLDLWRVGVTPDPGRLATEKGKEIASNTDYASLVKPWIVDVPDDNVPSNENVETTNKNQRMIFNKTFWMGLLFSIVIIIVIIIIILIAICWWVSYYPMTDCDSCINGTTP